MATIRREFPPVPNNPEEKHWWYYLGERAAASIAYVYHYGFQEFRWELLWLGQPDPIYIGSLEEGERMIEERLGPITRN